VLRFELAPGLRPPPGGIVLRPPLARPLARVEGDGVARSDARGAKLAASPARVKLVMEETT
jgi:hypothetical protein